LLEGRKNTRNTCIPLYFSRDQIAGQNENIKIDNTLCKGGTVEIFGKDSKEWKFQ
jgi:hypothetical protein